jgi:organic radical activating enzyme
MRGKAHNAGAAEPAAWLTEAFSSVQGEGPWVGVRQIFLRFYGCHRRCMYCDSPETVTAWQPAGYQPGSFRIERTPGRGDFTSCPNPVTVDPLMDIVAELDRAGGAHHSVALTGGEPLLQSGFLRALLPRVEHLGLRTYLDTAGDLYRELDGLLPFLDVAAMDIKLPSVTLHEAAWGGHRHFLKRCVDNEVEVFAKAVVSAATDPDDIEEAARVLADTAPQTLLVLQPMTPHGKARNPPTAAQLLEWQAMALKIIPHVRVIPQCHKMFGAL